MKTPKIFDKKYKLKGRIKIVRTEQWEHTAFYKGLQAVGSSETSAELHLLRLILFGNAAHASKDEWDQDIK